MAARGPRHLPAVWRRLVGTAGTEVALGVGGLGALRGFW